MCRDFAKPELFVTEGPFSKSVWVRESLTAPVFHTNKNVIPCSHKAELKLNGPG